MSMAMTAQASITTNKYFYKSQNMLEYIIKEQQRVPMAPTSTMASMPQPTAQTGFGKPLFGGPSQPTTIFGQPTQQQVVQQPQLTEQQLQTIQKSINQAYQLRGSTLKLKVQETEPQTMTVNQYLNVQPEENKYQQNLSPSEYLKQQFAYLVNNLQYEQTKGNELPQIATYVNTAEQLSTGFKPAGQFVNTKLTSEMLDGFKSRITGVYSENQDINPRAPKLSRIDYFTMPPLQQLQQMQDQELLSVSDFKISRVTSEGKLLGQIAFKTPLNLLDVNLDNAIHIEHGVCHVLLNEQASYQLNAPAVVTMYQIFPGELMDPQAFAAKIQLTTNNIGAKLINYDYIQGEWIFEVSSFMHFGGQ